MIPEILWRKSSFSGGGDNGGANCVETATLPDGRIAVRDSKNPVTVMCFDRAGVGAWIEEIKAVRLG
jgi:hypothetical protein